MNVIYKYELHVTDRQTVLMPRGFQILNLAEQRGRLCIWAKVDNSEPLVDVTFVIHGTGNEIIVRPGTHEEYIGTILMESGFVWHLFESLPIQPTKES